MIVSYKYKLKGQRAAKRLAAHARSVNKVWNYCVDTQRKANYLWRKGQTPRWLTFFTLKDLASGTSTELGMFFVWRKPRPRRERGQEHPQSRAGCSASC